MDKKTKRMLKGFGFFLGGLAVGAAVALMIAPQSGERTRDMLSEKSGELKDKAANIAKDTRDRAQQTIGQVRNKAEDQLKSAKAEGNDSKKELKRKLEIMEEVNNPSYPL